MGSRGLLRVVEWAPAMHDGRVGPLPSPPPDDDDRRRSLAGGSPGAEHPHPHRGSSDPDLLGLYVGTPLTERGSDYTFRPPDQQG